MSAIKEISKFVIYKINSTFLYHFFDRGKIPQQLGRDFQKMMPLTKSCEEFFNSDRIAEESALIGQLNT